MFLNVLAKNDRKHFLNLARFAMGLNGEDKAEEVQIFQSFVHECELHGYQAKTSDEAIESSIQGLVTLPVGHKRAVMIELCGIMLADSTICDNERAFMGRLATAFELEEYEVRKIERWVSAMNDMVAEGYQMVGA
ncbi:hypothetical protein SAMN04488540_10983 [Ferrimonas sediminum]|uniref:Tellurite resistance protein TerB n=1 Tax=Ferrimonas sediminum TaxID=718193 RepID=A0A1G8UGJ8_9GAMM|nr:hypothetical protein [Ferrimonas sediminum]SDJ52879.1 hypothetical protein SAMN04488540_10983 [Ferrimonas sediminum]